MPTPKIIFRGPVSSVPRLRPRTVLPAFLPDLLLACRHHRGSARIHSTGAVGSWQTSGLSHSWDGCVWLAPGQRAPAASAGHLCHRGWWLGGGCLFILVSPSSSSLIRSILPPPTPISRPSSLPHCLLP